LWLVILVEAPGTAPGSEWFITTAVYRHSRLSPTRIYIGLHGGKKKVDAAITPNLESADDGRKQGREDLAGWRRASVY
jgi:hypothetical protein